MRFLWKAMLACVLMPGVDGVAVGLVRVQAVSPQRVLVRPGQPNVDIPKAAIQVSKNDVTTMLDALTTAANILAGFGADNPMVAIEIVAYGPGLHMLRADSSPVKDLVLEMSRRHMNLKFVACGATQANQTKAEGARVRILAHVDITPSGAVRLIELQEQGYAYITP